MSGVVDAVFALAIYGLMAWVVWRVLKVPMARYRERRRRHYEENPDPLFGEPE